MDEKLSCNIVGGIRSANNTRYNKFPTHSLLFDEIHMVPLNLKRWSDMSHDGSKAKGPTETVLLKIIVIGRV